MRVSKEFLDTPLAELEGYGVSVRILGILEKRFKCLYVGDLADYSAKRLRECNNLGPVGLRVLVKGLAALRMDLINDTDTRIFKPQAIYDSKPKRTARRIR